MLPVFGREALKSVASRWVIHIMYHPLPCSDSTSPSEALSAGGMFVWCLVGGEFEPSLHPTRGGRGDFSPAPFQSGACGAKLENSSGTW